ncbi:MAG: hypothetical protein Q9160_003559 [Pyrenula sp. 1 TL-2023]
MSGYAGIAMRMAASSDLTSVRQFSALSYQNILYLQAELTALEEAWRQKEEAIRASGDIEKRTWYPHDWERLGKDPELWPEFLKLRQKLKEYSVFAILSTPVLVTDSVVDEALVQQSIIAHFEKPSKRSLKAMNHILEDSSKNEYLLGRDSSTWSEPQTAEDLVTIGSVEEIDRISLLLMKLYLALTYKLFGRWSRSGDHVIHIAERSLLFPTKILAIMLSSLLPVAAIAALYVVRTMWRRLLILSAFTSMFSVTLALLTVNSKRSEIFAATATYIHEQPQEESMLTIAQILCCTRRLHWHQQ